MYFRVNFLLRAFNLRISCYFMLLSWYFNIMRVSHSPPTPLSKGIVTISTTQLFQKPIDVTYPVTISKGAVDRYPTRTAGFHIYSLNFTVEYTSKFETTARVKSGLPSQFNAVLIFFFALPVWKHSVMDSTASCGETKVLCSWKYCVA